MDFLELKKAFGRRVQALREMRGLSQEQLADRIHRSVDTVSNIERGANSTRIDTAAKIAEALQVELPELFDHVAASGSARARRRQIAELADLLDRLDDRTFELAFDLLRKSLALGGIQAKAAADDGA